MQIIKRDPVAYILILVVLGLQVHSSFLRADDTDHLLEVNDKAYEAAVFDSDDNRGVMHQIFRQNEVDRELLKVLVAQCGR